MNASSRNYASPLDERAPHKTSKQTWDWGLDDASRREPYCCYVALFSYRILVVFAIAFSMWVRLPGTEDAVSSAIGCVLFAMTLPAPLILGLAIAGLIRRERPLHLVLIAAADSLPGLFVMALLAKTFFTHSH